MSSVSQAAQFQEEEGLADYFEARALSGSPNSQNDPAIVYSPAAAILTEQKPPWAA